MDFIIKPKPEDGFIRFQCSNCGWQSEPFQPQHSLFDISCCLVCNPPENGIMMFDTKGKCPGCCPKPEEYHV